MRGADAKAAAAAAEAEATAAASTNYLKNKHVQKTCTIT